MPETHAYAVEEECDHVEDDAQCTRHVPHKEAAGEGRRGRDDGPKERYAEAILGYPDTVAFLAPAEDR